MTVKKILMTFTLLFLFSTFAFSETDHLIEDYIESIDEGHFTSDSYKQYEKNIAGGDAFEALRLFLEARIFLNEYDYALAQSNLESSLELLENNGNQRLQAEVLYYLMELENYFFNLNAATEYALTLRDVSESIDHTKGIIEADYMIAYSYIYNYKQESGLNSASEAFELSRKSDYQMGLVGYTYFLSNLDYYYVDKDSAIEKLQKAYSELPETVTSYVVEAPHDLLAREIAELQIYYGDAEAGLTSIEALQSTVDPKNLLTRFYLTYAQAGYYYDYENEKALKYYLEALELYEASSLITEEDPYEMYLYQDIGNTYYNLGNYQLAADYYNAYINYDYVNQDDAYESVLVALDDIKYAEINSKMDLLDQLNVSTEARVELSNKLVSFLTVGILTLLIAVLVIVLEMRSKAKTEKALYKSSTTDSLTKAYNRGKIIDIFESNLNEKNGLILLDIDNFKNVNDTFGHIVGDEVLFNIAEIIRRSIREGDSLGRYGGEEFLVFLKNASPDVLKEISERVRENIENYNWGKEGLKTTASLGATLCFSDNAEEVLHEADTLMYKAKRSGKNRIAFN